jgi:hypothetical protein
MRMCIATLNKTAHKQPGDAAIPARRSNKRRKKNFRLNISLQKSSGD